MPDWYDEGADWMNDGDEKDDSLYPVGLYWPPVGDDDGATGCGEIGIYALL